MGCISRENCTAHGCPAYFDCPSLTDRQPDKCYLYGKVYAIGEQIPTEETTGSCVALRCSGSPKQFTNLLHSVINDEFSRFDEVATFSIAYIECPELFFPRPKNCIRQFKSDQCCSSRFVCGDDRDKLKTCQVGNKTYYEGQRYDVEGDPCKACICTVNSEGGVVENCFEQKCTFEFTDSDRLLQGAAPVYKNDRCCPVDWRLPSLYDKISQTACNDLSNNHKCQYGNLTLNIGDTLENVTTSRGTISCRCEIPPLVHCVLEDATVN
ncbi:hypothetical protein quinque_007500 [Culex quinquefasciatus]